MSISLIQFRFVLLAGLPPRLPLAGRSRLREGPPGCLREAPRGFHGALGGPLLVAWWRRAEGV